MAPDITAVLKKYGVSLTVRRGTETVSGFGVIIPSRDLQRSDGGIVHRGDGISCPERFEIFAQTGILTGAKRGEIVSDGENEYYVLWTDEYKSSLGGYTKAYVRRVTAGK